MDLQTEVMKRLLIDTAWDWLEKNKRAIGDKWYEKISKHLRRADSEITDKASLMGYALWLFNILGTFGVLAGMGPDGYTIKYINERLDKRSTRQLLTVIQMCVW
ncbi:MAG: hypothetical protein QXM08_05880 [Thermofilaceae archaeon]